MKRNGAMLAIYALEQIGVRKTFGIPGAPNSPLYDALFRSVHIEPIIVASELSAAYMADAVSRTTDSIGTIVVVQGAGITHVMSAAAQANIDGIPLLIISGSNKKSEKTFRMHQFDLHKSMESLVKKHIQVTTSDQLVSSIYEAYNLATRGGQGPVLVEILDELLSAQVDIEPIPYQNPEKKPNPEKEQKQPESLQLFAESETSESKMERLVKIIASSKSPGLYVGWGAIDAFEEIKQLAEKLVIPVSTSLQGISAFPYSHPLHTGVAFGKYAVPASKNAFAACDCLIAVGVKFSELSTIGYQLPVPSNLIHIHSNPDVFYKNYQPVVAIPGDSADVLKELLVSLSKVAIGPKNDFAFLSSQIQKDKEEFRKSWLTNPSENTVSPGFFFNALRNHLPQDTVLVTDLGNHRFHAAELFPVLGPRQFICPSNSNSMGYGIPAAIGVKILNKSVTVAGIISESEILVNGLEMITAQYYKLGILIFIIRDWLNDTGITPGPDKAHVVKTPVHRSIDIEKYAATVHAEYFMVKNDIDISGVLTKSRDVIKTGKNVVIEVNWNGSRKPLFLSGFEKSLSGRISMLEKLKMLFKSGD